MPEPAFGPGELTLHIARSKDLPRLGKDMANCLASYGRGRIGDGDRIVEVRRGSRTLYAVHVRAGRVVMFEAAGNRRPPREDVPLVHDLLRRHGLLETTAREAARSARPRVRRPRPAPTPATRAPRQPAPPPPPPGVSVQQLAAALLTPPALEAPEWPELAAALWAAGRLPHLPDPSEHTWGQIVLDVAARLALGDDSGLPQGTAPALEAREEARRRLCAPPPPRTVEAYQRLRMAEVLAAPVRP